jgi:hypothetical protein
MSSRLSAKEQRACAEREQNTAAKVERRALPYPNLWDVLDPTKQTTDTPEQRAERYLAFNRLCPKAAWKTHVL